jgi:FdhE protein
MMHEALEALAGEHPIHAELIRRLDPLITARAALVESLELPSFHAVIEKDRSRFLQGAPLVPRNRMPLDGAALKACLAYLLPALKETFPPLASQMDGLAGAFRAGRMRLSARMRRYLERGDLPEMRALEAAGCGPDAAALALGQIAKALAEAVSRKVLPAADLSGWNRGYCPVCGSPPELSYLEGKEGVRKLSCSLCSASWRFTRVACPSCESVNHEDIEVFYAKKRPQERAEACNACKRYVLAVDRRERVRELVASIEPLSLLHLDMLMQEKGYLPVSGEAGVTM